MGGSTRSRALATALAFVVLESTVHYGLRNVLFGWFMQPESREWLRGLVTALALGAVPAGLLVALIGARAAALAGAALMAAGAAVLGHGGGALTIASAITFVAGVSLARVAAMCLVAEIYEPRDPARDIGFTLYIAAANFGGFCGSLFFGFLVRLGPTIAATVAAAVAGLAAVVALVRRRSPAASDAGSSPAVVVGILVALAALAVVVALARSQLSWIDLRALASTRILGVPITVQLVVTISASLLLAPLLAFAWWSLGGRAPSSAAKIAIGVALAGAAAALLLLTDPAEPSSAVVTPSFLLDGVAELCFAPIALSLVTAHARGRWRPILVSAWLGLTVAADHVADVFDSPRMLLAAAACLVASILGFFALHRLSGGQARARR